MHKIIVFKAAEFSKWLTKLANLCIAFSNFQLNVSLCDMFEKKSLMLLFLRKTV